jgi:glutamate carboxypeptidase
MKHLILTAAALCACLASAQAQLSDDESRIRDIVAAQENEAIAFLETIVDINSGTMNHDGVRAVGGHFSDALADLGFQTEWESFPEEINRAGHLVAKRSGDRGRKLLLIGHLDTVFDDAAGDKKFRVDGDVAYGAGVADMKGGDVVLLYALKALNDAGALDGAQIDVIFTGDEELTGKPVSISRKSLIDAAKRVDVALNFEGGEQGAAVTARRGASGWTLTTSGLRRHSSGIFSEETGAGAVFEAARILDEFYEKLSHEKYLTFNPGVILGGTDVEYDGERNQGQALGKTNVVAQKVIVDGGLRFISEEQKERARARMRKIVEKHRPQTGAEIEFVDSYPAMTPSAGNQHLLEVFSKVSADMGYGPVVGNDPAERGAADISFAAPYVTASMDGLGPDGSGAHTLDESLKIATLREATERAAILIYRLTRADAPEFSRTD